MKGRLAALMCFVLLAILPLAAFAAEISVDLSAGSVTIRPDARGGILIAQTGAPLIVAATNDTLKLIQTGDDAHAVAVERVGDKQTPLRLLLCGVRVETASGNALDIRGDACVELILVGENTLNTANATAAAVHLPAGSSLVLSGDGSLCAAATNEFARGAGIGGDGVSSAGEACGSVTITGGAVRAQSVYGAGIGGGDARTGGIGGDIIVTGGDVTAVSIDGAGIGGGCGGGAGGSGGVVTVSGGKVFARSDNGAGIGGGYGGDAGGSGGKVTVSGGEVCAQSGSGAGVGGGHGRYLGGQGGTLAISGGTIRASSDKGAAIGGGYGRYTGGNGIQIGGSVTVDEAFDYEWTRTEDGGYTANEDEAFDHNNTPGFAEIIAGDDAP